MDHCLRTMGEGPMRKFREMHPPPGSTYTEEINKKLWCGMQLMLVGDHARCSPVLVPQMTPTPAAAGEVTEKASDRHCDVGAAFLAEGRPGAGTPPISLVVEVESTSGPASTNRCRSSRI